MMIAPLRPAAALLLAPMLAAGCAHSPQVTPAAGAAPSPAQVSRAIAQAAARVQACYLRPRVASEGLQIVTRLRVKLNADGHLAEMPEIVAQDSVTPANRPYAASMAEAARAAVVRCAPLALPRELHERGWDEFELTFSPRASA
jgi:hypothetical protein